MKTDFTDRLPEDWEPLARVFTALGDPHRQRILFLFEPGERLNITQIVAAMPLSRTAVVHHLRVLAEAGVLHGERQGNQTLYAVDSPRVREALGRVIEYLDWHGYP
ncbi:MAG: metalloregulator ArsR/SmtB family transcription factor [Halothiobacillaceae bacterium]|jgi:DNA-binding transcriptional ArsR family regulator|nr:metalloregulator ArsR/SmtB family transcription factor [Halothiobacillaceae bacterium]MDY0050818.1 metalloregulator ArsR/SmtB family transcription factor [Halothiobacillaceae bacterium]